MKLKFVIPSLLAAGITPLNTSALAAVPKIGGGDDGTDTSLFDAFKLAHKYTLAAHRSHASHSSHGSHRSSSGGGAPVYRAPAAPRLYNPTPPSSILPTPPEAPKVLPGNSAKFKAIVMNLQTCLSLFGFYPGVIDGAVGPETSAAISKFQEQWGFPITGTVTPQVLDACGIAAK